MNKKINALANLFYRMHGCQVEMGYDFSKARHPQEKSMFNLAKLSHEFWQSQINETKENFLDLLNQSCGTYNREKDITEYDHCCLSSYQNALSYAIDMGWIQESQLTRGL